MSHARATLCALALAACTAAAPPPAANVPTAVERSDERGPPGTRVEVVVDTYHGVEVEDPYRWLERSDDPEVQAWSAAQNDYARTRIAELPDLPGVRDRVRSILSAETVTHYGLTFGGGRLFAMKRQPPRQQPFLVVMDAPEAHESARIVFDPNAVDRGGTSAIDWFVPSPDGKHVAISVSRGGSEVGDLHLLDVDTGETLEPNIVRVNAGTAGGDVAWSPDGKGFYYTRYPRDGERPADELDGYVRVYFHRLGTAASSDRYELGEGFAPISEIALEGDSAGRVLATVQLGDGGKFSHFLRNRRGKWMQFSEFGDGLVQATFGPKRSIYAVTRKGAPRGKIIALDTNRPNQAKARTVVAEGSDTITTNFWGAPTVSAHGNRLYVTYQLGGPSEVRAFSLDGKRVERPKQLPVSSVGGLTPTPEGHLLFANGSYVRPTAWYRYDPKAGRTTQTALATQSPVDLSGVEVRRELATSRDGTKVPLNILLRKGTKLDRSSACVAYGYGGYGISMVPGFNASIATLLEQGVVYVVANLRGGAEFGDSWRRDGALTNKQNVFDDFAAVLQHLIDRGYTAPDRLGIMGGSNGGLLMGATLTQHPSLAKAVVASVGIYDMLRVELSPNGRFNVTEFGTVANRDHFQALRGYSPYHNVKDRTAYPAVLFLTGRNDPRVDPMQSRKMTARLQGASSSDAPILLRTSDDTGHGGSTPLRERIEQSAHVYAFLLDQLGVDYDPTKVKGP